MNDQLGLLIKLQKTDQNMVSISREIEKLPLEFERLKEKFLKQKEEFNLKENKLNTLEKDLRSKERKLAEIQENLKYYNAQIYKVKTQKEMEALDQEILTAKSEISRLEDKIIELIESIESLSKEVEIEKITINDEENKIINLEKKYQEDIKEKKNTLSNLKEAQRTISENINKSLLDLYYKLLKSKNNLAVVPIKNNICQGCFMVLPPQIENEVRLTSNLIRCQNCVRILYWEDSSE